MKYTSYHDLLNEDFDKRKQINPAYSLRAFARDLGISAPRLSQILNKKQGLSLEAAQELVHKLRLTEQEKSWFCDSVGALHSRSQNQRTNFKEKFQKYKNLATIYSELQLEYFTVISDWYHFAILELTYHQDFQNNMNWIADTLGITVDEASGAIERMKSLDLIREEGGRLIDVFKFLETGNDIPSTALKKYNMQLMKKAMEAMYEQDVNNREYSSNIVSIRKEQLPEFKEKIRNFRRELDHEAGMAKGKDSVYCLSIQFYELTRRT